MDVAEGPTLEDAMPSFHLLWSAVPSTEITNSIVWVLYEDSGPNGMRRSLRYRLCYY